MIKLKNILLTEGLSDILYHYTSVGAIINILRENKFHASNVIGGYENKISGGKFFYFSAARSLSNGYVDKDVCIVLDGVKLRQRYKGFAVDYWSYPTKFEDWGNAKDYIYALRSREQEDRIILNEPTIDNATKYILGIHIFFDEKYFTQNKINFILTRAKNSNIPVYVYDNKKYYKFQIKSKAIDINTINIENGYPISLKSWEDDDTINSGIIIVAAILSYKNDSNYLKIIRFYENKYKDFKQTLDTRLKDDTNRYLSSGYDREYFYILSSAIKTLNMEKTDDSRFILKFLTNDFIKNKIKNLEDYIRFKMGKL